MAPRRFVLDTNLVVPALVFRSGRSSWLREAWRAGLLVPLISLPTIAELTRVLAYQKFGLSPDGQAGRLSTYFQWCEVVDVPNDTLVPECRDPSDVPFLQLAVAGRADALVTGDADLLALAAVFDVPILTAPEAWERLTDA